MSLRVIALLSLFWTVPVQAQAELRVILLGSEPADSTWVECLETELDAEGGELIRSFGPGSVRTGAEARVRARRAGADAAVWIDSHADELEVHALVVDAPRELAASLATGGDGRTVALVVVSLLDEARESMNPEATRRTAQAVELPAVMPSERLDEPLPFDPGPHASDRYESWVVEDRPIEDTATDTSATDTSATDSSTSEASAPDTSARSRSKGYAAFGLGALALLSDVAADGGAFLRAVAGIRPDDAIRVQANLELGLFHESLGNTGEAQPFVRLCPELAATPRINQGIRFSIGAHGCLGFAEVRFSEPRWDGTWDYLEGLAITLAAGGFVGVEVSISDGTNLWIRADLDGTTTVDITRQPDVLMSLSTTLEVF